MKKLKAHATSTLFAICVAATSGASAEVITFDDVPYTGHAIANGYHGFDWHNMYAIPGASYPGTGYDHGVVSGTDIGFNGGGDPASFSSATAFTLVSIDVTKAWYAGMTHFQGFVGAGLAYEKDVFSTTTSPVHVVFNWGGLTRIVMSDGGSGNPSNQTAIDNVTIGAVPEPETYAMLLAGLSAVGFFARRRQTLID